MINLIISDIKKALSADAYLASFALALSLPDNICGRAKYPNESSKFRYIKWYDEYIGKYEYSAPIENDSPTELLQKQYDISMESPYLSGEVIYQSIFVLEPNKLKSHISVML